MTDTAARTDGPFIVQSEIWHFMLKRIYTFPS
jgi:hypothetical protein